LTVCRSPSLCVPESDHRRPTSTATPGGGYERPTALADAKTTQKGKSLTNTEFDGGIYRPGGELDWDERREQWVLRCTEHGELDRLGATVEDHDRLVFTWTDHDKAEHNGSGKPDVAMLLDPALREAEGTAVQVLAGQVGEETDYPAYHHRRTATDQMLLLPVGSDVYLIFTYAWPHSPQVLRFTGETAARDAQHQYDLAVQAWDNETDRP
jgi:hypothetical protein